MGDAASSYAEALRQELGECSVIDQGNIYRIERGAANAEVRLLNNQAVRGVFPRVYPLSAIEAKIIGAEKDRIQNELCGEIQKGEKRLSEFDCKVNPVLEELIRRHHPLAADKNAEDGNAIANTIIANQPKPKFKDARNGTDSVFASIYPFFSFIVYGNVVYKIIQEYSSEPTTGLCIGIGKEFHKVMTEGKHIDDFLDNYADALEKYERWTLFRSEENRQSFKNALLARSEKLSSKLATQDEYDVCGAFTFVKSPNNKQFILYKNLEPWAWDLRKIKSAGMPNYVVFPHCTVFTVVTVENTKLTAKIGVKQEIPHPFVNGSTICYGDNLLPPIPNEPKEAAKTIELEYLNLARDLMLGVFKAKDRAIYHGLSGLYHQLKCSDTPPQDMTPVVLSDGYDADGKYHLEKDYRYLLD